MKLSEILFIDSLPHLDLHGFDRDYARLKINEFIEDNYKMGNQFIVIVHGVGSGILRNETMQTLKSNKKVIDYQIYRANIGCSIAKIIIK